MFGQCGNLPVFFRGQIQRHAVFRCHGRVSTVFHLCAWCSTVEHCCRNRAACQIPPVSQGWAACWDESGVMPGSAAAGRGVRSGDARRARRRATSRVRRSRRPGGPRPYRDGVGGRPRQRDAGAADGRRARPERPAAADPGRPDIEGTGADETVMRFVAVFAGRAVRGASPRHYRPAAESGRRRLPQPVARWGESGSDGALKRPFAL